MGLPLAKCMLPLLAVAAATAQQPPLASVHGRAIDGEGRPVAGCAIGVFAEDEPFDTAAVLVKPAVTTDVAGRYVVATKPVRRQVVVVTKKGYQVCILPFETTATAPPGMLDALMLPGGTLTGRVRDATGKPIAGAWVRVGDPLPDDAHARPNPRFGSHGRSDERGIFAVPGVPRTGLRVTASAPGFPGVSRLAAHDTPLDLTLAATGVVRGRVLDAAGEPVRAIQVSLRTLERRDGAEYVVTDADGHFAVTAPDAFRFVVTAHDQGPPWRAFSSRLLRGPADDVDVVEVDRRRDVRRISLRCVDAATKAPVEHFHASQSVMGRGGAGDVLLQHPESRKPFRREATFEVPAAQLGEAFLAVDANGYGAVAVRIPEAPDEPLVVELPAACTLIGRVLDTETGKPAAGCAVRALPSSKFHWLGGGPDPWRFGAVTDADGRYRIDGLAPGDYDVQAYGVGRPSAHSTPVKVATGPETTLDVELAAARFATLELVGDIPDACLGSVWLDAMNVARGDLRGTVVHWHLPLPSPFALNGARTRRLGPFDSRDYRAKLLLPTRDRLGSALTIDLGAIDTTDTTTLLLPVLRTALHRGRVRLPTDVRPERVGVLAHRLPEAGEGDRWSRALRDRPFAVCLGSDSSFAIDLPQGRYVLQLLDLETGLVFHTDDDDRPLNAASAREAIEVVPACRWLTIRFETTTGTGPMIVHGVQVRASRPRAGALPAMLGRCGGDNHSQYMTVPCAPRVSELRWLVPAAELELEATQSFGLLSLKSPNYRTSIVDTAHIDANSPAPRVTLRIPPPPDDATILAPQGK